jgi:hypothetical protein
MDAVSGYGSAKQEIAGGNPRQACGAQLGDQITARLLGIVVKNITTGRVDEDPRCRAKGGSIHPGAIEERAGRQGNAVPIASRKCQAMIPAVEAPTKPSSK